MILLNFLTSAVLFLAELQGFLVYREGLKNWEPGQESSPDFLAGTNFSVTSGIAAQPAILLSHEAPKSKYYHWVNEIIDFGNFIELEDGSRWTVAPTSVYKAVHWGAYDHMVITPNHHWLPSCAYCITNPATGSYVEADLYLHPIPFGPYTHWVVALDKYAGHVFLEDGSSWKVSYDDRSLFEKWEINNFIIIGENNSWFSSYEHILINVNAKHHIRVNLF